MKCKVKKVVVKKNWLSFLDSFFLLLLFQICLHNGMARCRTLNLHQCLKSRSDLSNDLPVIRGYRCRRDQQTG